jgi:hypothetical protein
MLVPVVTLVMLVLFPNALSPMMVTVGHIGDDHRTAGTGVTGDDDVAAIGYVIELGLHHSWQQEKQADYFFHNDISLQFVFFGTFN